MKGREELYYVGQRAEEKAKPVSKADGIFLKSTLSSS